MTARFEGFGKDAYKFLSAIDFHQSRDWFVENRALYDAQLREPLLKFCEEAAERARKVGWVVRFDAKKGPFRINRDVRFSNDKRPYNRHVSAVLSPDGTKRSFGVLYVHVGLEQHIFAAGYWALPKDELTLFRRNVVTYPDRYRSARDALAKSGLAFDRDDELKRLPRGWDDGGGPDIGDALRLRGFTVTRAFDADAIFDRTLIDQFTRFAGDSAPLFDWGASILA